MSSLRSEERTRAENLVSGLSARLNAHTLWDALMIIVPWLLAFLGTIFLLVRSSWLSPTAALVAAATALGLVALAIAFYYRSRKAELAESAGMLDRRAAGAREHFLTLTTIDRKNCPQTLLSRLQRDTERLSSQIELKRDFPYTIKNTTYGSAAAALAVVWLLYFLLPPAGALTAPSPARLRELAEQMAQAPELKALAEQLNSLAAKLENTALPEKERLSALQQAAQKVADQQKAQNEQQERDLLSRAAGELKQTEQQLSAGGQEQQNSQSQGGGNLQSNLPEEGKGGANQSQGSGGDGQTKMSAQTNKDMPQGKPSQQNPNEPGQGSAKDQTAQRQGPDKGDQPDPNRAEKNSDKEKTDPSRAGPREGSGKSQGADEPPQMTPPQERFYRAGEGKEELKGARYVTVQLPEEIVADAKGESKSTRAGTGGRARTQVPVSNVPLPPHVPNAPAEKQQLPVEYRGIIR